VISDFIVTNCQLLADLKSEADDRLTVQSSEDNLLLFIAVVNLQPHPLGLARVLILKFNLDVIASLIGRHGQTHESDSITPSYIIPGLWASWQPKVGDLRMAQSSRSRKAYTTPAEAAAPMKACVLLTLITPEQVFFPHC
jgi:hypothetical protein